MARRPIMAIESIAAEVGRLLGTTEVHARKWMEQRKTLLKALHLVQGKAGDLISELTGETRREMRKRANVRMAKVNIPAGKPIERMQGRKKRRMSAATSAKMAASQKTRGRTTKTDE